MGISHKKQEYENTLVHFLDKYTPSQCYGLRFVYARAEDDDPDENDEYLLAIWAGYIFLWDAKVGESGQFLTYFL
jgi:hypothetical protein